MLANTVDDMKGIDDGNGDFISVTSYDNAGTYMIYLGECDGGAFYSTSVSLTEGTLYYLTVVRDESVGTHGTVYCYIYTDSARTISAGKLELALHTSKKDYQYLYACNTYNSGDAHTGTGYTQNLTLSTDPFGVEKGIYVHDDGTVDMAMQSGCRVYVADAQAILTNIWEVMEANAEDWDIQNEFNTTTYTFTAIDPGRYLVTGSARFSVGADEDGLSVAIRQNAAYTVLVVLRASGASSMSVHAGTMLLLDANDTIDVSVRNSNNNDTIEAGTSQSYLHIQKIA